MGKLNKITDGVKSFLFDSDLGKIVSILTALASLLAVLNLIDPIVIWIRFSTSNLYLFFTQPITFIPRWIIFLILTWIIGLAYYVRKITLHIHRVAGDFYDDFSNGLNKWNFDGDWWTQVKEGDEFVLSVTRSERGGITQNGLWDSFSFSFKNKLLSEGKIGWIVKARDRSNYIMLQLVMVGDRMADAGVSLEKGVYIRPHFRHEGSWIAWPHYKLDLSGKLKELIRRDTWFEVNIQVIGDLISVYIEKENVYSLHVEDPLTLEQLQNVELSEGANRRTTNLKIPKTAFFSFHGGKVGFRCSGGEHAWIKDVRVIPSRYS